MQSVENHRVRVALRCNGILKLLHIKKEERMFIVLYLQSVVTNITKQTRLVTTDFKIAVRTGL